MEKDKLNHHANIKEYSYDLENWKKEAILAENMIKKDLYSLKQVVETQSDLTDEDMISAMSFSLSENND